MLIYMNKNFLATHAIEPTRISEPMALTTQDKQALSPTREDFNYLGHIHVNEL